MKVTISILHNVFALQVEGLEGQGQICKNVIFMVFAQCTGHATYKVKVQGVKVEGHLCQGQNNGSKRRQVGSHHSQVASF